ncbi:protein-glutamine gamma-glutamyltransferase [Peribacillus sp. SCS-155]|uniref:protein-glutamine gamma-glutamyltransferase n=1 Tax=Peribacillus sedimenti TaxID=3115297 RepID=UPI0039065FC7
MILLGNMVVTSEQLHEYIPSERQRIIVDYLAFYPSMFQYQSYEQLMFELLFRENTLKASEQLNYSDASFSTFKDSRCNKMYWDRLSNGGFLLREHIEPSAGIVDIIRNGSLYAFECSTGMAVVLYLAALYSLGPAAFNRHFRDLYLMDWQFDEDFKLVALYGEEYVPGDILYFKNPEFHPDTPQWRGENAIFFGRDTFFGHGIGITSSSNIIRFLNNLRRPDAKQSAYLMSYINRPDYWAIQMLMNRYRR